MTIKEYYPIARIGDEIKVEGRKEKVLKIADDCIHTNNMGLIYFWNEDDKIQILSQAIPDWDNLKAGDIMENNLGIWKIEAILRDIIFYVVEGKSFSDTKQELQANYTIKDTREDKGEEKYGNKVYIRSYCECGCDCPTCHIGVGEKEDTDPKDCVYCQLKWAGKGEYNPEYRKEHGMKPLKESNKLLKN